MMRDIWLVLVFFCHFFGAKWNNLTRKNPPTRGMTGGERKPVFVGKYLLAPNHPS